ncbi:unnamed protein product [Cuscuta campestris]|uniref:CCHC-type domain-containing protein n=1 Tax=Cuscuta campestris TaxID=132261 RepID=A0A484M5H8_9ASTE|nr:unnamed protein product [Cuscuta campestris]
MRERERSHQFLMGLNDVLYGTLRSNLLAQEIIPPVSRIYNILVQDETARHGVHKGESSEAGASVFAVKNKMEVKELMCSHCGKTGHDIEACYKLIGYPEGWVYRDQAGRGRGNGRGRNRGAARGGGRTTVAAGRSTVTGGRGEVHAVQGEEKGPSPLPNFEDLTPEQWNAVRHALSLSPTDNSQKLSGEMLNEDGASVSSPVEHYDNEDDMTAEEQLNRSTRNGRPEETSEASELQTVDPVDRPAVHGRPSERQKDGPLGVQPTVDVVDRPEDHGRPSEGQKDNLQRDDETVDHDEENGRPSLRQKEDAQEPLQTVDPVDRCTDGGRPSFLQNTAETLGRGQRERRPNDSLLYMRLYCKL